MMDEVRIIFAVALTAAAFVFILFIFAVTPRLSGAAKLKSAKFRGKLIAHRGLHSVTMKENTAAAFRAAVQAGYGIEFDVRVSADNVPVISHDSSLKRVFGIDVKVEDIGAIELAKIGVPTLAETLEIAGGRAPLVVELKMDDASSKVCELTAPLLKVYKGDYCVESFHPAALVRWKKLMPDDTRGQLSSLFRGEKKGKLKYFILRNLLMNFLTRPDFIAYDIRGAGNLPRRYCRACGTPAVAWTIRSQAELDASRKYFDTFIFENFLPEKHEE